MISNERTRWSIVFAATAAGIAAGLQVGKVPPAIPAIRESLDIGLVAAGWIASIFNLTGATLAIASGLITDHSGARRVVSAGLLLLALGAFAGSFAEGTISLLLARTLAGLGLVTIAVASPRLIVSAARPRDYGLALGIWSIYMPCGMALAMVLAPLFLETVGWRGFWLANALLMVAIWAWFMWATRSVSPPVVSDGARQRTWRDIAPVIKLPGPWILGAIFGCYALQFFAMLSWLPTLLIETQGMAVATASLLGALAVAANMIGNLGGAWLMHRHVPRWTLQLVALVVMALCAAVVFSGGTPPGWIVPAAFLFSAAGGLLPAATLASSAFHAPRADQVGTVNGVIVQGANLGSLSGPPLMALAVSLAGGWTGTWWLLVISGALGMVLIAILRRVERGLGI